MNKFKKCLVSVLSMIFLLQPLPALSAETDGYIDVTWVEKQPYSEYSAFSNGIGTLSLPSKSGEYNYVYINDKGKQITSAHTSATTGFGGLYGLESYNPGVGYIIDENNNWIPVNRKGENLTLVPRSGYQTMKYLDKGIFTQHAKVVDIYGRTILDGEYDFQLFNGSKNFFTAVGYGKKTDFFVANLKGKHIFPFKNYERYIVAGVPSVNNLLPVKDRKTGKIGFYTMEGKQIIPFVCSWTPDYSEGRYIINNNGKWGYIDASGKVTTPIIYDNASRFINGAAAVWKGKKYAVINKDGKLLSKFIYNVGIANCTEGMASVGMEQKDYSYKYGYVSLDGKPAIACTYDYAGEFSGGLAIVRKNGKYGIINKSGKIVLPLIYDTVKDFYNGLAVVVKGGKYGMVDNKGKFILPLKYSAIDQKESFKDFFVARPFGGGSEIYDKNGKLIFSTKYTLAYAFIEFQTERSEDKAFIMRDSKGKLAFFNFDGKQITGFKYDNATAFIYGLTTIKVNGKYGMVNTTGKEVLPAIYDYLSFAWAGPDDGKYIRLIKDRKLGLADNTGKVLLPCEYDKIGDFNDGIAWVEKDGKLGLIKDKNRFSDMSTWAKDVMSQSLNSDLVPWECNGYYTSKITRLQFAGIVTNLVESITGKRITPASIGQFRDTYADYALRAYSAGIMKGYGNDYTFAPYEIVTREQALSILNNAIKYIEKQTGRSILSNAKTQNKNSTPGTVPSWINSAVNSFTSLPISPKQQISIEETLALVLWVYNHR